MIDSRARSAMTVNPAPARRRRTTSCRPASSSATTSPAAWPGSMPSASSGSRPASRMSVDDGAGLPGNARCEFLEPAEHSRVKARRAATRPLRCGRRAPCGRGSLRSTAPGARERRSGAGSRRMRRRPVGEPRRERSCVRRSSGVGPSGRGSWRHRAAVARADRGPERSGHPGRMRRTAPRRSTPRGTVRAPRRPAGARQQVPAQLPGSAIASTLA